MVWPTSARAANDEPLRSRYSACRRQDSHRVRGATRASRAEKFECRLEGDGSNWLCFAESEPVRVALPPKRDTGYAREIKVDEVSAVLRYGVVSTMSELREHGRDNAVP